MIGQCCGLLSPTMKDVFMLAGVGLTVADILQKQADAARQAARDVLDQGGKSAGEAAYEIYLQVLAQTGYFDPDTIATANDRNLDLHAPEPPAGMVNDAGQVDSGDSATATWLYDSGVVEAQTTLKDINVGSTDEGEQKNRVVGSHE